MAPGLSSVHAHRIHVPRRKKATIVSCGISKTATATSSGSQRRIHHILSPQLGIATRYDDDLILARLIHADESRAARLDNCG